MAFQGFARQEEFSTNQINIDIASVIDKDLAEASRQSKFMAKNSQLQEKWGNMYLNAMINKHEVEKRNREENFKFFMDNREKIQKQIQYNWEVKAEDASRSHPYIPSFMDMLHPALAKMAVDVGAKAIGKYFSDQAAANQEAKNVKRQGQINAYKSIVLQSGGLGSEQLQHSNKILDEWHKSTTEQRNALIEEGHAMGKPGQGYANADLFAQAAGLPQHLRQSIAYSPEKVATQYQTYSQSVEIPINGRNWTSPEILQASPNTQTTQTFLERRQEGFLQQINFHSLNGTASAQAIAAVKKYDADFSRRAYNSQVKNAVHNLNIGDAQTAEALLIKTGSAVDVVKWATNPDDPTSPASRMSMTEAHETIRNWAKNDLFSRDQVRQIIDMPGFGTGKLSLRQQHDLNDGHGTNASRFWFGIMDAKDAADAQALQNYTGRLNLEAETQAIAAERGEIDEITARNDLEFYSTDEGKGILAGMSPSAAKRLVTALSNAAGILPPQKIQSPGWEFANDEFTNKELDEQATDYILDQEGDPVSLSTYDSKFTAVAKSKVREAYKTAVANIADTIITEQGLDRNDPRLKSKVLEILSNKEHTAIKDLMNDLRAETGPPGGGVEQRYKVPKFPGLDKDPGEGAKSITAEYNSLKADKKGPVHWKDLNSIYNHPVYLDWAEKVNAAIQLGGNHVQNVLSNAPPEVKKLIRDQHGGSAWQAYMNARQYGGEKYTDFKPLSGADGLDYNETMQHYADMGQGYKRASEAVQKIIDTRGYTPSAALTAVYTAGNIAPPGGSSGQHTDVKATDGSSFPEDYLDNYVVVGDREYGMVPLSQVGVTDTQAGHRARVPASHGIDYGTYAGDKIYLRNGAYVVSKTPTKWGDLVKFKIPTDKRTFQFLHGTAITQQQQQQQYPDMPSNPAYRGAM